MNGISRSMQKIIQVIPNRKGQVNRAHIELGCDVLSKGGVIAVPTDTLYGLAARVEDSNALDKIYDIKGRNQNKPLAIAIASLQDIRNVAKLTDLQMKAAEHLLPGPVTLLLERSQSLNPKLNPGVDKIGVRIPDHNLIIGLTHVVGPIALTSANKSGETSPVKIEDFEELWPQLDYVFDQGLLQSQVEEFSPRSYRLGSTVVDLTNINNGYYEIIRDGLLSNRTTNILLRLGIRPKKSQHVV